MSGTPLEMAAFVCLGVAVVLLFIRVGGPSVSRRTCVFRFRRKLKGLEAVMESWAEQTPRSERRLVDPEPRPIRPKARELGAEEEEPPAAAVC